MNCSRCGKILSPESKFCSNCGKEASSEESNSTPNSQHNVAKEVTYYNSLLTVGWIIIIIGAIYGFVTMARADTGYNRVDMSIFILGIMIIVSSVITSFLYFGVHKVLLKVERIEQRLGIMEMPKTTGSQISDMQEKVIEERKN
jgi:hypothetical protein